jgi:hypothetical protein
LSRRSIVLAIVAAAIAFGVGAYTSRRFTRQAYPFSHAAHTRKANCELCHRGVRQGAAAGIIDLTACTGCHALPPGAPSVAEKAVWQEAMAGKATPWNRLYRLPPHVMFSHRRHVVLARLDCAGCHGDIAERASVPDRPREILKMRDCLGCHEREKVTVDCTGCHR